MISVVMPAYNSARFVREAVESILNQTHREFELIIIDDGSSDNTVEILREYEAKDSRVCIIQTDHQGANAARNVGMQRARYPWIAMMDSDDVAVPHRLERQLAATREHPDVVVWGCYVKQLSETGKVIGFVNSGPPSREAFFALDRTREAIAISTPTALINRDVALRVGGFDTRLPAAQEIELWDRMSDHGPAVVVPEPLLLYRIHSNAISVNKFYEQRMLLHFPPRRRLARAEGRELTLEQYIADYKNKPLLTRLSRYRRDTGYYYYRHTAVLVSQKRYIAAGLSYAASVMLSPILAAQRTIQRLMRKRT